MGLQTSMQSKLLGFFTLSLLLTMFGADIVAIFDRTATQVLAAVQKAMTQSGLTKVTMVGHSLGAALSLLESVYLPLFLPKGTTFKMIGYGLPRVSH